MNQNPETRENDTNETYNRSVKGALTLWRQTSLLFLRDAIISAGRGGAPGALPS